LIVTLIFASVLIGQLQENSGIKVISLQSTCYRFKNSCCSYF